MRAAQPMQRTSLDQLESHPMTLHRRHLLALAPYTWLLPTGVFAAGDHGEGPYDTLKQPFPTNTPGKIEVLEFLWFGCPHCAKIDPYIEVWEKTLPANVVFRREHIVWDGRAATAAHAKLFATLRAMGVLAQQQPAAFVAVHRDRMDLTKESVVFDWAAQRGLDRAAFESTYKSFGVSTQVTRMRELTKTYGVEGVPMFFVNGKYSTEPHRAGGETQLLQLIDRLVAMESGQPAR